MRSIKKSLIQACLFMGLYCYINVAWEALELIFYHKTMPDNIDGIVGLVL